MYICNKTNNNNNNNKYKNNEERSMNATIKARTREKLEFYFSIYIFCLSNYLFMIKHTVDETNNHP